MFVRKSKHDAEVKRLNAEIAKTGVLLTAAKESLNTANQKTARAEDSRDIAFRQNAHQRAEIEQLERDVAALLPDAEKYRAQKAVKSRNLRQFRKPAENGAAAH